jgi:NAD-dependent dihydropyrimidine dehydrogenase PreA subunit
MPKESMNVMKEETFHGVPRNKIPWHPTIDYSKCVSCGKCVNYCKLGVYEFEEQNGKLKPVVKNPTNCVVYCNGCDAVCPQAAISHPSKKETAKAITQLRKAQKQS